MFYVFIIVSFVVCTLILYISNHNYDWTNTCWRKLWYCWLLRYLYFVILLLWNLVEWTFTMPNCTIPDGSLTNKVKRLFSYNDILLRRLIVFRGALRLFLSVHSSHLHLSPGSVNLHNHSNFSLNHSPPYPSGHSIPM